MIFGVPAGYNYGLTTIKVRTLLPVLLLCVPFQQRTSSSSQVTQQSAGARPLVEASTSRRTVRTNKNPENKIKDNFI